MINKILGLLQGNRPEENSSHFSKVQLATCALLLEVAYSDGAYQVVEARIVNDLLSKKFDLSPAAVAQLIDHAQDHRSETHDLFQFAREINAHFGNDEKLEIMECVWQIIYADSTLDKFEDALARQLATLLRLPHKDVIDRKLKVLNESRNRQADS
ncbi:MAG: hypothetical protein C0614_03465 [Desulfuromonas sp.]|nr:MAG: hypothetical protein C0614_03465 [Desulfuromonas sp.]